MARRYGFYLRVVKTILLSNNNNTKNNNITIITISKQYCSSHRVICFLLYRFKKKAVNDAIDIFTSEDMENMSLVIF